MILTPSAVVLAADSTVTIENKKTYAGVNKLFKLSNDPPMGIMTYNNAEFLSIPIETIIKEFAKRARDLNLFTLDDIVSEFKSFQEGIVIDSLNVSSFSQLLETYFEFLNGELKFISIDELQKFIVEEMIDFNSDFLEKDFESIKTKLEDFDYLFEEFIPDCYESDKKENLKEDLKNFFIFSFFFESFIGIVIAGFEENNFFPSYVHFKVTDLYDGLFLLNVIEEDVISDNSVIIKPFAQDDVINTFLKGFDEYVEEELLFYFSGFFNGYYLFLMDTINESNLSDKDKNEILMEMEKFEDSNKNINELFFGFTNEVKREYENSLVEYISFLPYGDLCDLAEALINITSIKRKIQDDLETVGGPIDVVVITKGDGFIWSKHNGFLKGD